MINYESNSHRSKELEKMEEQPSKKIEKVVTGAVKKKKKKEISKFVEMFSGGDIPSVKYSVVQDVIVPAIKDMILGTVETCLCGKTDAKARSSSTNKTSYTRYYEKDTKRGSGEIDRTRGAGYIYDDIVLDSRGEAEEVLYNLDELIDHYGQVSVADLYDLVGVTSKYTDNKYGWTDIRRAEITRLRNGGYLIRMPKAWPLD